jgi:hypothetical protein
MSNMFCIYYAKKIDGPSLPAFNKARSEGDFDILEKLHREFPDLYGKAVSCFEVPKRVIIPPNPGGKEYEVVV